MTTDSYTVYASEAPPIPVPFDGTADELIQAGRLVAELREHPGYALLLKSVRGFRDLIDNRNVFGEPTESAATYADVQGEKRGLSRVDAIARGVIANAEAAVEEQRRTEERGS